MELGIKTPAGRSKLLQPPIRIQQRSVLRPHPNAEILRQTHTQLVRPGEMSQPVGLPFGSVRPVIVDGSEYGEHERTVPRDVVVRPRHELLADLEVGGPEVRGPDLRSEEDEVLGGAEV